VGSEHGRLDFWFKDLNLYIPLLNELAITYAALFGGEGLFFATLRGPGKIWLQSLPFSRMANRIVAASKVGGGKEQGSVLGGLFEGDN
jgi:hypothetical protein